MEYVDYYKVLGVSRNATEDEIHKAFKNKARQYHPDLNKAPDAEDKFKQINEAHEVIGNPKNRKQYDRLGANWKHGARFEPPPGWSGNPFGGQGGHGFSDFFESFFSGGRGGGGFSFEDLFGGRTNRQPQMRKGRNVEGEISITLEEAVKGTTRAIQVNASEGVKKLDVKVPAGVKKGSKIRLAGQGGPGYNGGSPGDVILKIKLLDHPRFTLKGNDLHLIQPISPWDAALGSQLEVEMLAGSVSLKIPECTSSGQKLRLKGKGMPNQKGPDGDLYVETKIIMPQKLRKKERKLFEQLKDISKFKP